MAVNHGMPPIFVSFADQLLIRIILHILCDGIVHQLLQGDSKMRLAPAQLMSQDCQSLLRTV